MLSAELGLSLAHWDGADLSCEVNIVQLIKEERKLIQRKVGRVRGNKQGKQVIEYKAVGDLWRKKCRFGNMKSLSIS